MNGFKCRYCKDKFQSEGQLRAHKKIMHQDCHPETGTKWFQYGCNLCQKRFFTEDLLEQHIKLHKGYPCNDCHNVYDTEQLLKDHKCKKFVVQKPLKELQDKILRESMAPKPIKPGTYKKGTRHGQDAQVESTSHYCAECDRYFKSGQSLGGHRSRVHSRKRLEDKKKIDGMVNNKNKLKMEPEQKRNIIVSRDQLSFDCVLGVFELELLWITMILN